MPDKLAIDPDDEHWNAEGYTGAILPLSELVEAENQVAAAADFFRSGRDRLLVG